MSFRLDPIISLVARRVAFASSLASFFSRSFSNPPKETTQTTVTFVPTTVYSLQVSSTEVPITVANGEVSVSLVRLILSSAPYALSNSLVIVFFLDPSNCFRLARRHRYRHPECNSGRSDFLVHSGRVSLSFPLLSPSISSRQQSHATTSLFSQTESSQEQQQEERSLLPPSLSVFCSS